MFGPAETKNWPDCEAIPLRPAFTWDPSRMYQPSGTVTAGQLNDPEAMDVLFVMLRETTLEGNCRRAGYIVAVVEAGQEEGAACCTPSLVMRRCMVILVVFKDGGITCH